MKSVWKGTRTTLLMLLKWCKISLQNKANEKKNKNKRALYLSVNVFSTKVLIRDTIFTSPNGDGTAILGGQPSHAKVQPPAGQRKYLHFSVILRPWVLVRPRESNPRPSALQSSALPTELILSNCYFKVFFANASEEKVKVFCMWTYRGIWATELRWLRGLTLFPSHETAKSQGGYRG